METVNYTVINLIVIVLAIYVGYHVALTVTPALHTLFVSVTKATLAIIIIIIGKLAAGLAKGQVRRVMSIRGQVARLLLIQPAEAGELVVLGNPNPKHAHLRILLTAGTAAALTLCMAAAMGVAPRVAYEGSQAPRLQESILLPDLRDQLEKLNDVNATYIREDRMQRGDTIASLLKRLGLEAPDALEFIRRNPVTRSIFDLQPGQRVQVDVDQRNLLVSLYANLGGDVLTSRELVIERVGDLDAAGYEAHLRTVKNDLHYEMRSGSIAGSRFFNAMDAANVPDDVVQQLLSIFSGVIDFQHDIVIGDRFRIVYEAGFRDGALVCNGRVVLVELINRDHLYQALWYSADGLKDGAYYTFDGRSMKRPFLRSPVEFSRVSSGFGGREHPLHHDWIEHKGVDLAAPTGTKVFATADGMVDFIGKQSGYGNIVVLKHQDGFSASYAHLSSFAGIPRGEHVAQGQLIGYVGKTGLATGPHLHYELRFNDKPQNPLSITLMESVGLTGRARQQFLSYASDMLSRINTLRTYDVAANVN